jgi:thiol-disulfide isomerase/thioredoxin
MRLLLVLLLISATSVNAQTISGSLNLLSNQEISLEGFNGFDTYLISTTTIDSNGDFQLTYSSSDYGMGYLISADDQPFYLILGREDIEIEGEALSYTESLHILKGQENKWFEQYASEHPRREAALSAWVYLRNFYEADSLFSVQEVPKVAITQEIARIQMEDRAFLKELPKDSYASWFLPMRKLVSSVSIIAQYRTEEIPSAISAFREIDYADPRLYRSGLLSDVLESQVWLIENSGRSLESVFLELNRSTDILLESLSKNPDRFNEVAEFLFDVLEKRSLFTSAEHLALNLLNNYPEFVTNRLSNKLEKYRAMRIGNKAPDIAFTEHTKRPDGITATRLSEVDADYILVVFAAQWCPFCREMMPELRANYKKWREYGVEVVMINLDETPEAFNQFTQGLTFISTTDFSRWNSPMAQAFHLSSIPTYYLLNRDLEIILSPNSIRHMDAWVDWYLVQGR